ncbi:putative uncharacterized protein DDB_G0291608 [Drosophila montana]|uniref:putative uncharacterized protein DDB_G0291608 n=1 Tax=Drosophila montana TaxID=40370 RepID=UPI00313CD4FA
MSLERSKFFAGARGVETNAFYGSMTLGAGEGHGFVAHTAARARFGGVPMRQQQQLQQLLLPPPPSSAEPAKAKVAKRRVAQPKAANTMPCTVEEFTRRAQALATGKAIGGGTAGKSATGGYRRNARGAAGAEVAPKKANATTTINRSRDQTRPIATDANNTDWSMPASKTATGIGRKPAARGVRRSVRVRNETPQTKWLLMPQSNFRQCSESSSEANSPINVSQQQLSADASWPGIGIGPSNSSSNSNSPRPSTSPSPSPRPGRQQIVETPTKSNVQSRLFTVPNNEAQPSHLQAKSVRSTTLLLQADGVKQTASVDNSRRSASSVKPGPNSNTNCSNGSYRFMLGLSGSSSSSTWSNSDSYDTPHPFKGGNKSIKLTSTVIKIMPDAPLRIITQPPPTPPSSPSSPSPAAATIAASRPSTLSSINKRVPPIKQPQPQQQQQQKPAQQQQLPKATATGATATATGSSKIVRVDQHKVPKTIEDGIDISYQYFVSTPVVRGKKPLPVRYLYRPMVRRLNQASTTARHGRRSGGSSSRKGLSEGKTEDEELLEQDVQLEQAPVEDALPGSSDIESSDSSTELADHNRDFDPPPIVVDAKYLPFVKQLKNHPWPQEQRRRDALQQLRTLKQQQQQQQQQQLQLQQQKEEEQQLQQQQQQQQQQQAQGEQEQQELKKAKQLQMLEQQQQLIQQQRQLIEEQQQQLLAQEQQLSPRPVLIDFQPNVTRLSAVGGANICYHAPIRMCAGAVEPATVAAAEAATTAAAATAAAAAAATLEIVEAPIIAAITYEDVELNAGAAKTVSFQLESDSNCHSHSNCNCNSNSCSQSEGHNNGNNCSVSALTAMPPKTERKRRKCKSRGKKKSRN